VLTLPLLLVRQTQELGGQPQRLRNVMLTFQ
jgi:hypothetical protein